MNGAYRHVTRALPLLLVLGLVVSAPLWAETADTEDDPFAKGAKDAAKKDPFHKGPPPDAPPKTPTPKTATPKAPAAQPEKKVAPDIELPPSVSPKRAEMIEKTIVHYLGMYTKHLSSREWVTRAMAVISLAKIDDPRITDKLLATAEKDRDNNVRIYAWEALHARTTSLSDEQYARWLAAGCQLVQRNALHGNLRVGLVRALGSAAPTGEHQRTFMAIFAKTNSTGSSGDLPVLAVMRETVAAWKSPELVRTLVARMGDINSAQRAEYVLAGLGATVASGRQLAMTTTTKEKTVRGKKWVTYTRMGSTAAWAKTRRDWTEWLRANRLTPPHAKDVMRYAGKSSLIEPAEKMVDPMADKWRKDLELPKFDLANFDVNFVLDSTGSMSYTMTWIRSDIARMMQALGLVSRRPRMGVTLYRDYVSGMRKEDYLVTTGDTSSPESRFGSHDYVVKLTPMMPDAARLAKAVRTASAYGGGDAPEAVYEALWAALNKNTWSRTGPKIVVLVGDAPPHAGTMDKIKALVEASAAKGFKFLCVKVTQGYRNAVVTQKYNGQTCDLEMSFNLIAQWGKGKAIAISPSSMSRGFGSSAAAAAAAARLLARGVAVPAQTNPPKAGHHEIIAEVLRTQLAEYYHDRVDPFVRVLLEMTVVSPPEVHTAIAPHTFSREIALRTNPPRPRPVPRPVPPRPRPVPRKIEKVYYVIDGKLLTYIYYDFDNKRAISAAKYVDNQGRYTWQYLPRADMDAISSRGKKITTERANEIMRDFAAGKDPFK